MEVIREQTKHVVGFPEQLGGSGDPSPSTARGVLRSVEAVAKKVLGRDKLEGLKIAIQGVGNVGFRLAEMLHESGASLVIADINQHRVEQASKKLGAEVVSLDEIFKVKCDIISPCALGAVITDEVANGLQCDAVVGAANNILADYNAGKILANRNIFYAPDYVANAGGLIHVAKELDGFDPKIVAEKTDNIYNTISDLVDRVKKEGIRPELLADRIAEERLMQARD